MTTYHDLAPPSAESADRSRMLTESIRQKMQKLQGRVSFADFMADALYDPMLGYYQNPGFIIGSRGDFTTAPEISPLFARCFARQCREIFSTLGDDVILELGAGSGRFALDILIELEQLQALPKHYLVYEISESLRQKQRALIETSRPDLLSRFQWLDELPQTFSGVVIANEVLDAMPFHVFKIINQQPHERMVTFESDKFIWQDEMPSSDFIHHEIETLQHEYHLAEGYQSEIQMQAAALVKQLCMLVKHGVILFADYGYGQSEYYHPQRTQGTLTCFYQHRSHNQPLIYPGLQDITTHVDFTRVISTAADYGAKLGGFTTQSAFLFANGLLDMAGEIEPSLNEADAFRLHQSIKTLTMPTEMGDLVKIMAVNLNTDATFSGFKNLDRRRDL